MNRYENNKKILTKIAEFIERCPDMRFIERCPDMRINNP